MNVISKNLVLILMGLFVSLAQAQPLQQCLNNINQKEHRLDRQAQTLQCFRDYRSAIDMDGCFDLVSKVKLKSADLIQNLHSICFYETTLFKDLNSCSLKASAFATADQHDDALFECYRQFQNQLDQKQCIELSRKLIYPTKKKYLLNHCLNNI